MICMARIFGAPVTVPAGKAARSASVADTPGANSPVTVDTRCITWLKRSMLHELGNPDAARDAHPPQVVAAQVDQHQVFGPLLLVGQQLVGQPRVLGLGPTARPRAGHRPRLDDPSPRP